MAVWSRETVSKYLSFTAESRLAVLHPHILTLLGDVQGCRVLDFGSGEARLGAEAVRRGATHVVAVDANPAMIDAARHTLMDLPEQMRPRLDFRVADEAGLGNGEFYDIIICSLVLMMAPTVERLGGIIGHLARVLTPEGRLFIAVTHPCFRSAVHSTFWNELPEGFEYLRSGTPYTVHIRAPGSDAEVVVTDFHWTIADYCGALGAAGLVVAAASEVATIPTACGSFADDPAYLVFVARRSRTPPPFSQV